MPTSAPEKLSQYETLLHDAVAEYYADPLGFVLAMFPWRERGTPLEEEDGPDTWQREMLTRLGAHVRTQGFDGQTPVAPYRGAVSSGHGIGKSTLVAWLVCWLMSTRPHCRGTVTANTVPQLDTKTWAAIRKWLALCRTAHWFEINSELMWRKGPPEWKATWQCAKSSSQEHNSEAFAGQHAKDSSSFYIFDEASAIAEIIYEVSEGGLTDGEPFQFLLGNATRSYGTFYRACFGNLRHRYDVTVVDSRESKLTNKQQIKEWITDYGEDSDFVRVRVRGLPPKVGDASFIPSDAVMSAQQVEPVVLPDEPLVCGLDVARGGGDLTVLRFRRGHDARSIPPVVLQGDQSVDSMLVTTIISEALTKEYDGQPVAACFVDATGGSVGGPVADRLRQLGFRQVIDVQFGGRAPEQTYGNMRSYIWARMRDWLLTGGAIDKSAVLEMDLVSPGYGHDRHDRLVLERKDVMKSRGCASPDHGDALALTFAQPVLVSRRADILAFTKKAAGFSKGPTGFMAS